MKRFCFVHAADLHLDTPFTGIGRVAPAIQDALRDASLDAFDVLVQLAIAREAVCLLLAGDIYDGPERGVRAQLRFRRGLEQLTAAGVHVFAVHGNHDPLEGWSAIGGLWPPGVTFFDSAQVGSVPVERDGRRLATIHGISYARRNVTENLALRFRRGPEPGLHIGLLHCNVGADPDHAPYSPCHVEDLRRAGMDYWALGHIHQRHVLHARDPWIVYPGNPQGLSPKPSECGPKGAFVVDVEHGAVRGIEFAPVDSVRFLGFEVDISGIGDLPGLACALTQQADRLRAEHEGRGLLLRATLIGRETQPAAPNGGLPDEPRGALREQLRRPGVLGDFLQELRRTAVNMRPFIWWDEIQDRTRSWIEPEAIRRRGDFSAELLTLTDELAKDTSRLTRLLEVGSEPLIRVLRGFPDAEPADDNVVGLLREAQALALDLLEADETP
jgi:DNA repair exonuclease SbcCD nuclease subunit